ncbi:MAG: hypothetical protein SFV54_20865 [Bryobacteraceae bacterium]|nr:hypothetical protein [Bryobacteraceae bacterium]
MPASPITLAELKALGEFVRWQDVEPRVRRLLDERRLPPAYPLAPSRLPPSKTIDLWQYRRWEQVEFVRFEKNYYENLSKLVYRQGGEEKSTRYYSRYEVAPAGQFTAWSAPRPANLHTARLLDTYPLAQQDHVIHSQRVIDVDWPYLTIEAVSFHPNARWVDRENMWTGDYTVHAADPRVHIEGIQPQEPWYNTSIALSHRWLSLAHPDPDGAQFREFLAVCDTLGLHDSQSFLIDYCSLPQSPRTPEEQALFAESLPDFQSQYKYVTIVLNTGAADYSQRAWCMLELMLALLNGAPQTLLNRDGLSEPLQSSVKLAESYLKHSVWNRQQIARAGANYRRWSADLTNVALHNASVEGRRVITEKFEKELAVTVPEDRTLILDLLNRLAFDQ